MSLVTPATDGGLDASTAMYAPQITGLYAGEDILFGAPLYIKSSDGKAYMSNGTALNEAAEFVGISPRVAKAGEPITAYGLGTRFRYATGLTPGNLYYVATTKGRYDTAVTTGDNAGTVMAVSTTDVVVVRAMVPGSAP